MDWNFAVGFAGNDRCSATAGYDVADMIAVITAVGQNNFCAWQITVNQKIKAFVIRDFTTG